MNEPSVAQIRAFRLRAHHLDRTYAYEDIPEAVGACGMQNTPPGSWENALYHRIPSCSLVQMERLLYGSPTDSETGKALLQAWSLRGAPFVFPASESGTFLSALIPQADEPWIYTRGITLALDYLGMEATEKAVYFAVVTFDTWKNLKRGLYTRMRIDVPGRGIAFLVPLSSIGGKKILQYLTVGQKIEIEEESVLKNTEYELLVTIANSGYTETIMDAARSAHAPGGTFIHAKGSGVEHAKKFLGICLAEEKEMVFIVVKTAQKNDIMRAIMEQAGVDTPAGALVFSVPVTDTAGIRRMEELLEEEEK